MDVIINRKHCEQIIDSTLSKGLFSLHVCMFGADGSLILWTGCVFDRRGECVIMTDGRGSSPPITSEDHSLGSISANRIQTDKLISKDSKMRTGLDVRVTSLKSASHMLVVFMMNCSLASPATPLIDIPQDEFYNL